MRFLDSGTGVAKEGQNELNRMFLVRGRYALIALATLVLNQFRSQHSYALLKACAYVTDRAAGW